MTYRDRINLLVQNYSGAHWTWVGENYEDLVWLDDPATKPTAQDLGF